MKTQGSKLRRLIHAGAPPLMAATGLRLKMGHLRQLIFGLSAREADFARRGFQGLELPARPRLEKIGRTFIEGYNASLRDESPLRLERRLDSVELEFRGFAFEGAAMGLTLMDYLLPWKRDRFQVFLSGAGSEHTYMMHVGAGWALARLRRNVDAFLARLDPLLRWLVLDGYGFHEGYFHWRRYIAAQQPPPEKLSSYARRVFDQGLGRSLWFVEGADTARISKTIGAFPEKRQSDLWSGIGLACAYAGGAERASLKNLKSFAGAHQAQLAQGCAFAAKTRQRAGNPALHTNDACQIICGVKADEAASVTDISLLNLAGDAESPAYEIWRRRIQSHFALEVTLV